MKRSVLLALVVMCVVAAPAFGQGGCVDSPENPTALLAAVGAASGVWVAVRSRWGRK